MLIWLQNFNHSALKMSLKKVLLHIYAVRSIYDIVSLCIRQCYLAIDQWPPIVSCGFDKYCIFSPCRRSGTKIKNFKKRKSTPSLLLQNIEMNIVDFRLWIFLSRDNVINTFQTVGKRKKNRLVDFFRCDMCMNTY